MTIGIVVLALLTCLTLIYPVLRLPILAPLDANEGWNALQAMRAMGEAPLYPAADSFFFNNYPPLSFYIVGLVGTVFGDDIIAGRVISLLSVFAIAVNVGITVRNLGGARQPAIVAGILVVAILSKSFVGYVGMNDPQLLAQAVMSAGFAVFTAAPDRPRNMIAAAAIMVLAGFTKHNIIAMPLAVTTWLVQYDRAALRRWLLFCSTFLALGFAVCALLYGWDFFAQLLTPRKYILFQLVTLLGRMQAFVVPLVIWAIFAIQFRHDRRVNLVNHLIAAGGLSYALARLGDSVAENSLFDLALASSIALGLALSRVAETKFAERFGDEKARLAILAALCIKMVLLPQHELPHLASHLNEMRGQAASIAPTIAFMRLRPGPAICEDLALCYWSGHLSAYDAFNAQQAADHGKRDMDELRRRIRNGDFVLLQLWPDTILLDAARLSGAYREYPIQDGTLFYR